MATFQLSTSCSSLLHWDDSTLAFPGFSWGSGLFWLLGFLALWLFGSFALSMSGLSGSSAFQSIGILAFWSTAGGGADQTIKRREFFAFFKLLYHFPGGF